VHAGDGRPALESAGLVKRFGEHELNGRAASISALRFNIGQLTDVSRCKLQQHF
jgi:hypothetical protein